MCRIDSIMPHSIIHKDYKFVDTRPKCAKCRARPADVVENNYFFCGQCAVDNLNIKKKRKNYKSNAPK